MLNDPHVIGRNVRKLRLAFGETQAELGQAIGVTNTAISNLEQGIRTNTTMVAAIARHYGVPVPMLGYEYFEPDDMAKGDVFVRRIAGIFYAVLEFHGDNMPADSEFRRACTGLIALRDEFLRDGTIAFSREKIPREIERLIPYIEGEHGSAALANTVAGFVLMWMTAPNGAPAQTTEVMGRHNIKHNPSSKDLVKLILKANDEHDLEAASPEQKAFAEVLDEAVFDLLADVHDDPEWADWANFYAALLYILGIADSGLDKGMNSVVGMEMLFTQARLGNRHSRKFLEKYYL